MKITILIDEIKYCYDNNLIINYDKKGLEYYFMPFDSQELCLVDFVNFYLDWLKAIENKYEKTHNIWCPFNIDDQKDIIEYIVEDIKWENRQKLVSRYNFLNKIKEIDWEKARDVPISVVLDYYKIKYIDNRCWCPIHWWKNDTSFWFKNNLYNCFSCWAKWNTIKLASLLWNMSKGESAKFILTLL